MNRARFALARRRWHRQVTVLPWTQPGSSSALNQKIKKEFLKKFLFSLLIVWRGRTTR